LPSDYEVGLLQTLKKSVPDLVPEFQLEGKGKSWIANLYSDSRHLVVEACSRKVKRTGRDKNSVQHIEKFYSMLLKLIDMKSGNPKLTPVMIWSDLVPASSRDLQLASRWGVYVLSGRDLRFDDIWQMSPEGVNRSTLNHLIRRTDGAVPRWHWVHAEQKILIEQILQQRASTTNRLVAELGLELNKHNRMKVSGMLKALIQEGKVKKLIPGHVTGEGIVLGTNDGQLAEVEGSFFDKYHGRKRRTRLSHYVLMILADEQGLNNVEIAKRLHARWQITASRNEIAGLLGSRLVREGKVHADDESNVTRYFLSSWWDAAHLDNSS
jgi:hypothetical protein